MIKTIQGETIRCDLAKMADAETKAIREFYMPSGVAGAAGFGAMSSDDTTLRNKPTGSLGSYNHIGKDELQKAYTKPAGQNPIGIGQNNAITGEPHFDGEFWDSNQNDIDSGDVSQMVDMLREKGVENVNADMIDQLRSGYTYEFNKMAKKDKYTAMLIVTGNLSKNPKYYDELDQFVDEMWMVPSKDAVEVRNGWPVGLKHKPKKGSDVEKKEDNTLEEIVQRVRGYSQLIDRGEGETILSEANVKDFIIKSATAMANEPSSPSQTEPKAIKKCRYTKYMLMEAINRLVSEEENTYWNKKLIDNSVPINISNMRQFREMLVFQIKSGSRNEKLKEILSEIIVKEASIMGDPHDPRNAKHMAFKGGRWAVKVDETDFRRKEDPTPPRFEAPTDDAKPSPVPAPDDMNFWTPQYSYQLKQKAEVEGRKKAAFMKNLRAKEAERLKIEPTQMELPLEETDQPTPGDTSIPSEPDFAAGTPPFENVIKKHFARIDELIEAL